MRLRLQGIGMWGSYLEYIILDSYYLQSHFQKFSFELLLTYPLRTSMSYTFVTLASNLLSKVDCVTGEKCAGLY